MVYQSKYPVAEKTTYTQNNEVSFTLDFQGMSLKRNSVRISGKQIIRKNKNVLADSALIFYDEIAGIHSFIQYISVSIGGRVVENNDLYNHWAKVRSETSKTIGMRGGSGTDICELKTATVEATKWMMKGVDDDDEMERSFSFKPFCCLNMMDSDLPYRQTGTITITVRLNSNLNTFFGGDQTGDETYEFSDLRLDYELLPDNGSTTKTIMTAVHGIRQDVGSNNVNITSKPSAVVQKMTVVFQRQYVENELTQNSIEHSILPGMKRVDIIFNDSTNSLITYPLESREEFLMNFLKSMGSNHNGLAQSQLSGMNVGGVGLDFGQEVDLTNKSIGLQLQSDVTNTDPWYALLFFHSLIEI